MPAHTKTGLFRPTGQYQVDMTLVIYRVYKKKLNKFEIALNIAKRLKVNLVPRLFLRGRKDPGRSWSRATQNLGGKLKKHLGRGGRVLRLESYNLCA